MVDALWVTYVKGEWRKIVLSSYAYACTSMYVNVCKFVFDVSIFSSAFICDKDFLFLFVQFGFVYVYMYCLICLFYWSYDILRDYCACFLDFSTRIIFYCMFCFSSLFYIRLIFLFFSFTGLVCFWLNSGLSYLDCFD